MATPKQTEIRFTYSVGIKVNLGNYESADAHLSEGGTWDVTDMTETQVTEFIAERYQTLRAKLGLQIENEAREMVNG